MKRRIVLAVLTLALGICADVVLQRVDLSVKAKVADVDVARDTVAFEFPESLPHQIARQAQSSHVFLLIGVLAALGELGVLRRRKR
ncbi:MAG TPA: hypothetical protein VGG74_02515 [Kofleriaceae bacterium]